MTPDAALIENIIRIAPEIRGDDELVEKFGEPIFYNDNGSLSSINQHFFAGLYKKQSNVIYDGDLFYLYNPMSGLWEHKKDEHIIAQMSYMLLQYSKDKNIPELGKKYPARILREFLVFLKSEAAQPNIFNKAKEKNFIHCANGVLEPDGSDGSWQLHPFSPEYYSRNRTEIAYDPEAKCPRFLGELLAPALPECDINLLQEYSGQCLLGHNIGQRILLVTGTAGGGKSTLVNILEGIIGRHNCTELRTSFLTRPFESNRFRGKTLLSAKDVPSSFLNTTGAKELKKLTGNDTFSIEMKGGNDPIDIVGNLNTIITSNSNLRIVLDSDSDAWKRRLLWILFESPPPEMKIPNFDQLLLQEEGSGILNWGLEGTSRLLRNSGNFSIAEEQASRIESLLLESDSIAAFVKACVIKENNCTVTIQEMLLAYTEYCNNKGWQFVSEKQFQTQLPQVMLECHRAIKRNDILRDEKAQRGFSGFRLSEIP